MTPQIESIQPDIFAKLSSEPYFATISLFEIRKERYQSEINEALSSLTFDGTQSGKLPGATIEILMPMLLTNEPDSPGPICKVEQRLIVKENPTINLETGGIGLTAESIAQQVLQTLHRFSFHDGLSFYPSPNPVVANMDFPGLVAYDVVMWSTLPLTPLPQCGSPANPAENSPLTLTFTVPPSDPTATIYYTTDGSFPGPGILAGGAASTATAYTVPFTVASGTSVRYAAYIAGKVGSMANTVIVT